MLKEERVKRFILVIVALASSVVAGTQVASALTANRACIAGSSYSASNLVSYTSSGGVWNITQTQYRYGPALSTSTHNNMNEAVYNSGGTLLWSYNSSDALVRDNAWHVSHNISGGVNVNVGAGSQFRVMNIIDVPGASDPSCGTVFN